MAIYLWKRGSKAVVEIIYKYDTACFHYCYSPSATIINNYTDEAWVYIGGWVIHSR